MFDYLAPTTRMILDLSTVTRSMALLSLEVQRETNSRSSQEREAVLLLHDTYNKTAVHNVATTTVLSYALQHYTSSIARTVTLRLVIIKPYHHKLSYALQHYTSSIARTVTLRLVIIKPYHHKLVHIHIAINTLFIFVYWR